MRRTSVSWARPLSVALVLLVAFTFTAPPASALEPAAAPGPRTLAATANAKVAALPPAPRAASQASPLPSAPKGEQKGFFKKPAGVAALVLMTLGTGYMTYSAFHDNNAVHSPLR